MKKPHTSIDEISRTVSWIGRETVAIGRLGCECCGTITPDPPDSVLVEFAQAGHAGTLWPDKWSPPGWTTFGDFYLCPECSLAARELLEARSTGEPVVPAPDLVRIRHAMDAAFHVVRRGLDTATPNDPKVLRAIIRDIERALLGGGTAPVPT